MEIEGDQELSSGRKAKAARTEKLPPAVEGRAEGASSPSAPDKVKALFTGAVMTPELAPKSTHPPRRRKPVPAVGALAPRCEHEHAVVGGRWRPPPLAGDHRCLHSEGLGSRGARTHT